MAKTDNPKGKITSSNKVVFFLDKPGRIDPRIIRKAVLEAKRTREQKRRAANGTSKQKGDKAKLP